VIWGTRAAVDAMSSQRSGHVINIASISGVVPTPGLAVYAATKAAVLQFSIALQGDLDAAGLPIRVSAVCPDAIETDMVRNVTDDDHASLLFSSNRLLRPDRVAGIVADLVEHPRLVVIHPPLRAALAHAFRPFPSLELRVLSRFWRRGDRNRRRRSEHGGRSA
jgi:short-subunit dehydrogenase